jgi:DNA helicase HerA-like ATPase
VSANGAGGNIPVRREQAMIIGQMIGGGRLELDLPALVDTRLLIQANSGGGKSWLLRLIAERAGIQTIILDNEGEFASLREAVDVLLVGASGELPANPRHAALLARRLLEYKVSAVIDLYELKLIERRRFVKLFLDSLIHLPRDLWRPTLLILDEAHIYCPERLGRSGVDRGGHQPDEPGTQARLRRHHRYSAFVETPQGRRG